MTPLEIKNVSTVSQIQEPFAKIDFFELPRLGSNFQSSCTASWRAGLTSMYHDVHLRRLHHSVLLGPHLLHNVKLPCTAFRILESKSFIKIPTSRLLSTTLLECLISTTLKFHIGKNDSYLFCLTRVAIEPDSMRLFNCCENTLHHKSLIHLNKSLNAPLSPNILHFTL